MTAWTCHAQPVALGGKPCGFLNTKTVSIRFGENLNLIYCTSCGCTKQASDDRLARKTNKERTTTP